jgi:DNA gyrase/topoisomerase IV subunit B
MYAGNLADGTALHNLVLGLATYIVAQRRSEASTDIHVILRGDGAATVGHVAADASGEIDLELVTEARLKAATSTLECIRLAPEALDVAGGVFCDMCVVNALSSWMCDQVWTGTSVRASMFRGGALESTISAPMISDGIDVGRSGASTTFLPDDTIFPAIEFDADRLRNALQRLGDQNPGIRVSLTELRA